MMADLVVNMKGHFSNEAPDDFQRGSFGVVHSVVLGCYRLKKMKPIIQDGDHHNPYEGTF
jgi:hypothetical protein